MTFRVILALALCGSGLLVNAVTQEEHYKYSGTILAGVMNPREAYSGSRIDMDVIVHRSPEKSVVEFKESKIGLINRMVFIGDVPSVIDRPSEAAPALNGQTNAYFAREEGTVMEVLKDDPHWVTEIRKAILNMLRIPPYIGDTSFVDKQRNSFRPVGAAILSDTQMSYFKTEETFAGKCNVIYTMNPDYDSGRWPQSPDSVLGQGNYFRLHRSIDFDSCHKPVSFQKTSYGNFSTVAKSQFERVQTRSASGEYVIRLRDDHQGYDVKGVAQTGTHFVRPFGQDTGRLLTFSNQTLSLVQVKPSSSTTPPPSLPSSSLLAVTSWNYQFVSPAAPKEETRVPWVIYQNKAAMHPIYPEYAITGLEPDQPSSLRRVNEILDEIVTLQLLHIEDHQMPYDGTSDGRLAETLNLAAHGIRSLTYDSIRSLYSSTYKNSTKQDRVRRQSFLDTSMASGSAAAIMAFLDEVKVGRIDSMRIAGLISSLVNNIYDPSALKDLKDYVMSLEVSKDGILLTSLVHLNFARLAKRVCVDANTKQYSVPEAYLGNKICDQAAIQSFVEHLEHRIRNAPTAWECMMYTQSLGSLGVLSSIPFIRDVALGKIRDNKALRIAAIHSLANNFNDHQRSREEVMLALLPIVEEHAEQYEFREAAFMTIMSMKPNASFFQRFAMDTWREPSYQMRSLVSTTFLALAQSDSPDFEKMRTVVRAFIPLMKPTMPSFQNSAYFDVKMRVPSYHIDVERSTAWLYRYQSQVAAPRQMMDSVTADFGGIRVPIYEIFAMYDNQGIPGEFAPPSNTRSIHERRVHEEIEQIRDALDLEMKRSTKDIYVFANGFNYQSFLPFDTETKPIILRTIRSLIDNFSHKEPMTFLPDHMVKYFNPVDVVSILPTPFGTPTIVEIAAPNNMMSDCMFQLLSVDGTRGMTVNLTLDGNNKMTAKTLSYMSVLLPWAQKTATAAYDTESTISIPGRISLSVKTTYPFSIGRVIVSPWFEGERPVMYFRSKPMTVLRPMGPISDITQVTSLVTPIANRTESYNRIFEVPSRLTGLKSRVTYQGDTAFPFQQSNVMNLYRNPAQMITFLTTPTKFDASLALRLNMQQSETRNIAMAAVADFGYLSNIRSSSMKPVSTSSQLGQQIAESLSLSLSPEELVAKTSRGELGDFLMSLSIDCTAPNLRTRQYEIVLSGVNQTISKPSKLQESVIVNIMRKGIPGDEAEKKACFVTNIREKVSPSSSSRRMSEKYTTAETAIYAGEKCTESERVATLHTELYLNTDERQRELTEAGLLSRSMSEESIGRPPWIIDSIYDRVNFDLAWNTAVPPFYRNMTRRFFDLMEGAVFPHAVKNHDGYSRIPENRAIVNVTRNVQGATVDAWLHRREEIIQIQALPISPIFDFATPLLGNRVPYRHHPEQTRVPVSAEAVPSSKCLVSSEKVITFDGVTYEKEPSTCYTVTSQVYHEDDTFTILTKQVEHSAESKMEVKILSPRFSKIEILSGERILINGQEKQESAEIKSASGTVVGSINKTPAGVVVSIPGKIHILVTKANSVMIEVSKKYRSFLDGLCGDFNGEKSTDMKSPKGCILIPSEGKIYAASWIPSKDTCRDAAVRPLIQRAVHVEQEQCHTSLSSNSARASRRSIRRA